jgi:Holliday junction resolvase
MPAKTKATDQEIIDSYAELANIHKVASRFGMCGQSVQERLVKLGIERSGRGRLWTPEEDEAVRREYSAHRSNGAVKELAGKLRRDYFSVARRAGKLGCSDSHTDKPWLRKIKDESHARDIFDKFKKSSLGLMQFCAKIGISNDTMVRHIGDKWPDEWDAVIESKAPLSSMYRLGRAFEYHTRAIFLKAGYFVMRSPGSRGPADLCCIKPGVIVFVQCKRGGVIPCKEWNSFLSLARSVGAVPVLAERKTGKGIKMWIMKNEKSGRKQTPQPMEPYVP